MNWLDIVIAIIVLLSVAGGIKKGFARTAIGFGATILGLFCGLWFYGLAANLVEPYVASRQIANLAGFLIIFLVIVILGALLAAIIERLLKAVNLTWLNRALGGVFGVIRGVLIAAVILLGIMAFSSKNPPDSVASSRLAPYVMGTVRVIAYLAPNEVREGFRRSYEKVKKAWEDMVEDRGHDEPPRAEHL